MKNIRKVPLKIDFESQSLALFVNSQNKIISFEEIYFWQETFLILYPSLENSTTHITTKEFIGKKLKETQVFNQQFYLDNKWWQSAEI